MCPRFFPICFLLISVSLPVVAGHEPPVDCEKVDCVTPIRLAAQHGDALMQYELSVMYVNGKHVPKDYTLAYAWATIAAANGSSEAKHLKAALVQKMTTEQLTNGQALMHDLMKTIKAPESSNSH